MFSLEGKVALVTGAGRGIGRAVAAKLTSAGALVMANDLDPDTLSGVGAASLAGDLTQPDFPGRLVEAAVARFHRLDIVVNNAGYTWDSVIQKTTDDQFQAMLDIHLVAPFRILRAAAPHLRALSAEPGRRKVVNITSISGTDGNPGQAGYSSGKAGVIGLTRTMAKEWSRYNVNVNAVGFGLIETRLIQPLSAESKIEVAGREIRVGVPPEVREKMTKGTPDDAAGPVLFFCSPLSDFVTGEVLLCTRGTRF